MYAIKISKTNRYISHCDNCWYETMAEPAYLFTKDNAMDIAKQMKSHYVYKVEIIDKDGNIEIVNAFNKNPMKETKKSIGKIRVRI